MTRVRAARLALAGLLLVLAAAVLVLPLGSAPASAEEQTGSAVTRQGSGPFEDLSVTVGQTSNLINQVVDIRWSGGQQTSPVVGSFAANYLQIMQCWGDEAEPRRENCQFGGLVGDPRGGNWVSSRQVSYGSTLVDPLETYQQTPGSSDLSYVPFESVTGQTTTEVRNEFYDGFSTNEIPFGRTQADGSGEEYFEVQTNREAPGLGCGQRGDDGRARGCWLVVVPRSAAEVDGSPISEDLDSSPLSASNWQHRISFRLDFEPVGLACPIGTAEERLVGQESIADAISRWQPVLCDEAGAIFGFSQIPDDLARSQVLQPDPWLSMVTNPLDDDAVFDDRELVYAPVAVSGVAIAFNIDVQPTFEAPPDVVGRAGTRVTSMRLNPRLVAKLLTQSYGVATLDPAVLAPANPLNLVRDPEFVALNPDFAHYDLRRLGRITVPAGLADAYAELWAWVAADTDAAAFITGDADPWGMEVNPAYEGTGLLRSDFPVSDLRCRVATESTPELCPLDYLAYAQDMHEAGRGAARGQTLARDTFNRDAGGGWRLSPPQLSGSRATLALVDTATAARYRLPLAQLASSDGAFASPDQAGLAAGLAAMVPTDVDGVLRADQTPEDPAAYPLTHITYAVTSPERLTARERRSYSRFLTYVATDGQVPGLDEGQLPPGYLPLTDELSAQTVAVAELIAAGAGEEPPEEPSVEPTDEPTDTSTSPAPDPEPTGQTTPAPGTDQPGVVSPPGPVVPPSGPAAPTAGAGPEPGPGSDAALTSASYATPSTPAGIPRFLFAGVLVVAAVLLGARPLVGRRPRSVLRA